jgi:hypothetical protein
MSLLMPPGVHSTPLVCQIPAADLEALLGSTQPFLFAVLPAHYGNPSRDGAADNGQRKQVRFDGEMVRRFIGAGGRKL